MRIGIDIDGVITDIGRFMADYGTKYRYDNNIYTNVRNDEYDERKALGLTDEQVKTFFNTYLELYATKYPSRDFASEIINKLKQNNEIYIITARADEGLPKETYGTMQTMVKEWLANNKIEYDELIFSKESKLPYCIERQIDIMIEDSPYNIMDISSKIPVLCFDNPYNKNIEGDNITRVYSWYDILDKIEKL